MPRSPSVSRVSPGGSCGTQAPPPQIGEKAAGVRVPPEVKVEFAGVAKSTWKRYSGQVELTPVLLNGFGAPTGGGVSPSRSAGMKASLDGLKKDGSRNVTKVAASPASIAARSRAKG